MKHKLRSLKQRKHPKSRLRLPDLEFSKTAVLNSLTSVDGQRGYAHAIDEFVDWYCSEPRLALNKTVVLRYRGYLEARLLAPGTINLRLGAVRRVAAYTLFRRAGDYTLYTRQVGRERLAAGVLAFLLCFRNRRSLTLTLGSHFLVADPGFLFQQLQLQIT